MTHLPGLSFDLGETIEMLRDTVRSFAGDEIAPRAASIDDDNLFPSDVFTEACESAGIVFIEPPASASRAPAS